MLTPGYQASAYKFAGEFRKKQKLDPYGYPLDSLIRTLMLNEFQVTSPNPVGPKTRAHTMRMAAAQQELNDLDDADRLDDQI